MRRIAKPFTLAAAFYLAHSGAAFAVPVVWTVNFQNSNQNQTVVGSFIYDADTNIYSSVNLTSTETAASDFGNTTYSFVADPGLGLINAPSAIGADFADSAAADLTGVKLLRFSTFVPLTNAGGIISGTPATTFSFMQALCLNSNCGNTSSLSVFNDPTPNSLVGTPGGTTPMPLPPGLPLLLDGLAGFWAVRGRCA